MLLTISQKSEKWEIPTGESLYSVLDEIRDGVRGLPGRIDAAVEKYRRDSNTGIICDAPAEPSTSSDVLDSVNHLSGALESFVNQTRAVHKQLAVLESLFFPEILHRQNVVPVSHKDTSGWIFSDGSSRPLMTTPAWIFETDATLRDSPLKFVEWLEEKDDIYWIRGKPGSGKSTLMKFIAGHAKTTQKLQRWSDGRQITVASHFFSSVGSSLQRSQEGLFRAILFKIFRACPELISMALLSLSSIFQFQGTPHAWTTEQLEAMVNAVSRYAQLPSKFAFFIDGLDEYEGEPEQVIRFLFELAESPDIKICVSSRPWARFVETFGKDPTLFLTLEDLTGDDIRNFTHDTFHSHQIFRQHVGDPRYTSLVDEVVKRADGVFLWVFLVCKSLLDGMGYADRVADLERRLSWVPPDLESFFNQIILSTDGFYREQTARAFLLLLCSPASLPLAVYSVAMDLLMSPSSGAAPPTPGIPSSPRKLSSWVKEQARRLEGHTKGLIEIKRSPGDHETLWGVHVEFLHLSVRDYLQTRHVRDSLQALAGKDYNPDIAICDAVAALISLNPRRHLRETLIHHAGRVEREHGITLPCLRWLGEKEKWKLLRSAVDAGMTLYVSNTLHSDPALLYGCMYLDTRPLLDTALYADNLSPAMVQILLDFGANPNEWHGETTVWGAFIDWLAMGGANISNPLRYAEVKEILVLLLSYGAQPWFVVNVGQTAEEVIRQHFHWRDVEYLFGAAVHYPGSSAWNWRLLLMV